MEFCTHCGKQIEEGQICECMINENNQVLGFWASIKNAIGMGDPDRKFTDCYERGQLIVPDNIEPTEGEIPVKQYNIAVLRTLLKFERAEGRMQITNKRVIFRAPGRSIGGKTTLQHEYAIDEIAGIEIRKDFKFSPLHFLGGILIMALTGIIPYMLTILVFSMAVGLGIILGLLFMAVGIISFFMIPKEYMLKLMMLGMSLGSLAAATSFLLSFCIITGVVALINLFFFFLRPNLIISIKNKMGMGEGPVDIRRKTFKADSTGFREVLPTDETEYAIHEIGAMIGDVQKLGDFGLQKWLKIKGEM